MSLDVKRDDPSHLKTNKIVLNLKSLISELNVHLRNVNTKIIAEKTYYRNLWRLANKATQASLNQTLPILEHIKTIHEPFIAYKIASIIPSTQCLYLGNSMPIRDMNTYGILNDKIAIGANRGANGIDGIISTAIGNNICYLDYVKREFN